MSLDVEMKIIRETQSGKLEELCSTDCLIMKPYLENNYDIEYDSVHGCSDELKSVIGDHDDYVIYEKGLIQHLVCELDKRILRAKEEVQEIEIHLKEYYQSGNYSEEIESSLTENLNEQKSYIAEEESDKSDLIFLQSGISFLTKYVKPEDYNDPTKLIYLVFILYY